MNIRPGRAPPKGYKAKAFEPLILHDKKILDEYSMTSHLRAKTDSDFEFKSSYKNLGEWSRDVGLLYPDSDLIPVCYGGMFMTQKRGLWKQPREVWNNLEKSLSRGDNIEEGHFVERSWASIVSPMEMNNDLKVMVNFITPLIVLKEVEDVYQGMVYINKKKW